jgi:hypothetical protein
MYPKNDPRFLDSNDRNGRGEKMRRNQKKPSSSCAQTSRPRSEDKKKDKGVDEKNRDPAWLFK